jgi:nucleoside phosphorylase
LLILVAADRREFSGFDGLEFRSDRGVRNLAEGELNGVPALFASNGVGGRAARAAARSLIETTPAVALISTGFAGALDPTFSVGDIFVADRVLGEGVEYSGDILRPLGDPFRRGSLLTVDHVVQSADEKRQLAASGAQAVDMEAACVAAVAAEHGLPFYCVRVVSDTAQTSFSIDFNRALREDGSFSVANLLWQAGWRRGRWRQLAQLKRDGELAARSLARFLSACEFTTA